MIPRREQAAYGRSRVALNAISFIHLEVLKIDLHGLKVQRVKDRNVLVVFTWHEASDDARSRDRCESESKSSNYLIVRPFLCSGCNEFLSLLDINSPSQLLEN
jgi:hypothetical protein